MLLRRGLSECTAEAVFELTGKPTVGASRITNILVRIPRMAILYYQIPESFTKLKPHLTPTLNLPSTNLKSTLYKPQTQCLLVIIHAYIYVYRYGSLQQSGAHHRPEMVHVCGVYMDIHM